MQRKTAPGFGMAALAAAIVIAAAGAGQYKEELDAAHHPEAHGSH
jgi:hypothetical protein